MSSNADGGFGVTFNLGDDVVANVPSYTAIAQVDTWNGIEIENVLAEITNHGSTGGFDEHAYSGMSKTSPIELGLVFDITQATHANAAGGLTYAVLQRETLAFQIVLADASNTTFTDDALFQKLKWESPKDNVVRAILTIKLTGQPTLS